MQRSAGTERGPWYYLEAELRAEGTISWKILRWEQAQCVQFSSVQFSHSVVSNSLRPHGPQHARPPCPSPTPEVCSNSSLWSWWCYPTISSSIAPFSSCLQSICSSIRVFSNESALHIRWPKYWSFSFNISPSNEHLRSCKFLSLIRFQSDAKTCGQADTVQPSS